jgi:hypothetical protein
MFSLGESYVAVWQCDAFKSCFVPSVGFQSWLVADDDIVGRPLLGGSMTLLRRAARRVPHLRERLGWLLNLVAMHTSVLGENWFRDPHWISFWSVSVH